VWQVEALPIFASWKVGGRGWVANLDERKNNLVSLYNTYSSSTYKTNMLEDDI
jgi:hypothetical protein